MRNLLIILLTFTSFQTFSQDKEKEQQELIAIKKANNFVHDGNELVTDEKYVAAEMEYRKAISERPNNVAGTYNLGNSYYKKGNFDEALYRLQQAAKNATGKSDKHKAFHNIGNILMKNKQCKEAVEAYKSALRNEPSDEETRYNLVIAKECAEQQKDEDDKNKDKNEDKKDENKDQKDKEGQDKENQDNKGDKDKKDGEDQKDQGKPQDDKQDPGKGDEKKEPQQQQPQPGQLSPQQIKNLLEAMNNQEQKTQEKINAEKSKGVKVRTEKDW